MRKFGTILVKIILMAVLFTLVSWLPLSGKTEEIKEPEDLPSVAPPPKEQPVSFVAVGDVMLARKLTRLINQYGIDYPFKNTAQLLSSADISFANLESPLSRQGTKLDGKGIWFRGNPDHARALSRAGFDVLSLANNHALDYDAPALLETMHVLEGAGIKHAGAGENIEQARTPVILESKGIKVAFLAYSEMADMVWSYKYPRKLKATEELAGIAPLVAEDAESDVAKIRDQVDYVFVSLHWGVEYQYYPREDQQEMAHRLIDAGADVILGHHPHCLQGVELYHQGIIAYSLGNFVFDQNQKDQTKQGLLLKLELDADRILRAELLPVYIRDGQPQVVRGDEAAAILQLARNVSEKLGTSLEITGESAVIMDESRSRDGGDVL